MLGSGVDVVYPAEHRRTCRLDLGLGSSGFLLPHGPRRQNPSISRPQLGDRGTQPRGDRRPRISKRGAIITANAAAAMGKEVMAVPGPLATLSPKAPMA